MSGLASCALLINAPLLFDCACSYTLARFTLLIPSLSPTPPLLVPPNREPRPADLAAISELEAQVAGLQQQLASYRAQLALLAPGGGQRTSSPGGGGKGGRPHLPLLSSIGQGLPQFPPPAAGAVTAGRSRLS